jgi:hypothetical protein
MNDLNLQPVFARLLKKTECGLKKNRLEQIKHSMSMVLED